MVIAYGNLLCASVCAQSGVHVAHFGVSQLHCVVAEAVFAGQIPRIVTKGVGTGSQSSGTKGSLTAKVIACTFINCVNSKRVHCVARTHFPGGLFNYR